MTRFYIPEEMHCHHTIYRLNLDWCDLPRVYLSLKFVFISLSHWLIFFLKSSDEISLKSRESQRKHIYWEFFFGCLLFHHFLWNRLLDRDNNKCVRILLFWHFTNTINKKLSTEFSRCSDFFSITFKTKQIQMDNFNLIFFGF